MNGPSSDITVASLGADAGYPNLNVASIPENVKQSGSSGLKAYAEGLSFEGMLVNELSQQLSSSMFGGQGLDGSDSGDGSGSSSSSDGSSGDGMLSAASAYSSLIPQTLTSSIMDSGGLGMAEQFAQEIDPSLATAGASGTAAAATASAAGGTSDSAGVTTSQTAPTSASTSGGVGA